MAATLHCDPAELGELIDDGLASEPPPTRVLDPADCPQAGAAATARASSERVPAATRATGSPLHGSRSSKLRPSPPPTHSPPMNWP